MKRGLSHAARRLGRRQRSIQSREHRMCKYGAAWSSVTMTDGIGATEQSTVKMILSQNCRRSGRERTRSMVCGQTQVSCPRGSSHDHTHHVVHRGLSNATNTTAARNLGPDFNNLHSSLPAQCSLRHSLYLSDGCDQFLVNSKDDSSTQLIVRLYQKAITHHQSSQTGRSTSPQSGDSLFPHRYPQAVEAIAVSLFCSR